MINRDGVSRRRRLVGGLVLGLVCADAGVAAWAAQPQRLIIQSSQAGGSAQPRAVAATGDATTASPAAGAQAKPASQPDQICITNACMKRSRAAKTVAEAVAAGDPTMTRALGGTETQVWQAIQKSQSNWYADHGRPPPPDAIAAIVAQAFDISDGSQLAFLGPQVGGPQGSSQLAMEKTYPDGTWQRIYLMPDGQTLVGAREPAGSTVDPLGAAPQKQP